MFPKRLELLRNKKNLTQQRMADMLGITRQAYGNYENGKRQPDYDTLEKLAEFFSVSADYLIGRTDDPTPPDADEPMDQELEELMLKGGLMFDGVPLDDDDKRDILDVMRIAWKTIQRRKQK